MNKMEIYIKALEKKMKSEGVELSIELKSILEYLYSHQNKNGQIYMSISDMVMCCDLYHLGNNKDTILSNIKAILFSLEDIILAEYSCEQIAPIKDLNELLILEFKDILK